MRRGWGRSSVSRSAPWNSALPLIKRKHATARGYVHDWLEPDDVEQFNFLTFFVVLLVVLSLAGLALETEASRADTPLPPLVLPLVSAFNAFIVVVFAIEFALRFWSEGENPAHRGLVGRLRFMLSPMGITDFLAFAPELFVMLFMPHVDGPWLAALRALRLFRLFKLARYVPAFAIVGNAVRRAGAPLVATGCVAAAQIYVAALLLHFIEGEAKPQAFGSVLRALWWAVVTLTTVGYGDVYPDTVLGRFAAALVALAGIGIVAMPTGILASAFADEFREHRERRRRQGQERQ